MWKQTTPPPFDTNAANISSLHGIDRRTQTAFGRVDVSSATRQEEKSLGHQRNFRLVSQLVICALEPRFSPVCFSTPSSVFMFERMNK